MRLRIVRTNPRGEIAVPRHGDLHSEINEVLSRSPKVFAYDGVDVRQHMATSPHVSGDGYHEVYWLNEPQPGRPVAWDDDNSIARIFDKQHFWLKFEDFMRDELAKYGEKARSYMYWGFQLPGNEQPEFPVVWRGLQSQPRLHFHIAESIEDTVVDDWLDSSRAEHIGQMARFLNLAGERTQDSVLHAREFGEKFVYEQNILGNDPAQTVPRTLFAFPSLAEAIRACSDLRAEITNNWLALSVVLSKAGPAVYSGQAFNVLQSAVPNFVFMMPSSSDAQRAGRAQNETWVAPFSVVGAPEMLTAGGLHLERR